MPLKTYFLNKRFELPTENIIPAITSEFGQASRRLLVLFVTANPEDPTCSTALALMM